MKQQNLVRQNPELFLDEQQHVEIDLSHYDLMHAFTARQAAYLIAGIDPNMQDVADSFGSPEFAKMRAIEDGIEQAYEDALDAVLDELKEGLPGSFYSENPPWLSKSNNVEETERMLPSIDLLDFWQKLIHGEVSSKYNPKDLWRQKFKRDDISRWLKANKFHGARYFLPEPLTNDNSSDQSPASSTELLALRAEIEQLRTEIAEAKAGKLQLVPEYLDPKHHRYSYRLAAAVRAWEAITENGNRGVKQAIAGWLYDNAKELGLLHQGKPSEKAIKDVATVVNWNKEGGAPKTC